MIGSVKKFVHMSSNSLGDGESDGQLGNFKKKKKTTKGGWVYGISRGGFIEEIASAFPKC